MLPVEVQFQPVLLPTKTHTHCIGSASLYLASCFFFSLLFCGGGFCYLRTLFTLGKLPPQTTCQDFPKSNCLTGAPTLSGIAIKNPHGEQPELGSWSKNFPELEHFQALFFLPAGCYVLWELKRPRNHVEHLRGFFFPNSHWRRPY